MLPGYTGHLVSESFVEAELWGTVENSIESAQHVSRADLARWRSRIEWLGPATSVSALLDAAAIPLADALGYGRPSHVLVGGAYIASTVNASEQPIALLVTSWGERLDPFWRIAVTEAIRRSAAWALLFNGTHLRLVDASRVYGRRFVEFNVEHAAADDRTCSAFFHLLHASALVPPDQGGPSRLRSLVDRSERHALGVSRSLRDGVLTASADVLGALLDPLRPRRPALPLPPLADTFEQALTIVYRILFLLFAEARGLVPLWHPVYRDSYSIESLRSIAERPAAASGLWDALRAIARLAHAGCRAGDLRVTPFNGRLFAPRRTPLADRRGLDDEAARRAVLALSTQPAADRQGRTRIAYRDLGVEQLGAVYERLLDYEPHLESTSNARTNHRRAAVSLVRGAGMRKATGSFYTPQPLADYLVRRTLAPLVLNATPEQILRLRVVDPSAGSGAFLVAACRYLADAYEAAITRAGGGHSTDFDDAERQTTRRIIAERCLFGVDVNPMAVQLARLSLWLATLAADRPLTFLDHHLQTGDSLLGAWLFNLRARPRLNSARPMKDQPAGLFDVDVSEALRLALPIRFSLADETGDTLERVRAKERALGDLNQPNSLLSKWKRIADAWCAPWFSPSSGGVPPSAFAALCDAVLKAIGPLPERTAEQYLSATAAIAETRRLFHWELEFPEVFFDRDGSRLREPGFDAVIGNPPWDMIRADRGSPEARYRSRSQDAALVRFTRDSGVYAAQSSGQANRYQLFLERSIALSKPGGRIGLVLPGGLLNDHGSSALRRLLFSRCDVDALVGFENQRGIFPIHRSMRFVLVTASCGTPTAAIACRLGERDPAALEAIGDEAASESAWFTVRVTPAILHRLSGESLAIPDLRSAVDLTILERAAALFPPLGSREGWDAHFGRELNVTEDRHHFGPRGTGLPVVEGKQIQPFLVDLATSRFGIDDTRASRLLDPTRYRHRRLAYRDVASATNKLTLIAAVLPRHCVSTHTVFCLRTPLARPEQDFLCGLFNSFVVNYFVRLRVTTHVTTAIVEALPVPRRHERPGAVREIAALARLLAVRSDARALARLHALVARLYQLTSAEFEHVLGTFPLIAQDTRDNALACFRDLSM